MVLVSLGASEKDFWSIMPTIHSVTFCVIKSCLWVPGWSKKCSGFSRCTKMPSAGHPRCLQTIAGFHRDLWIFLVSKGPMTSSLVLRSQHAEPLPEKGNKVYFRSVFQPKGSVRCIRSLELQCMSICVGDPSQTFSENQTPLMNKETLFIFYEYNWNTIHKGNICINKNHHECQQ